MSFDQNTADLIIDQIADGVTLAETCRAIGISRATIYNWRAANEAFAAALQMARDDGYEVLLDECLEIADDASQDRKMTERGWQLDSEHVQRSKLRIETRLKLLAKWDPAKYGERVNLAANVKTTTFDLPPGATAVDASRAYAEFVKGT